MGESRTEEIIKELKNNFLTDKKIIQDKIVEKEVEIRQCNEYIESLNKKDDCDYNIFSPRSASRVYKDQVKEKKLQIEVFENDLRNLYKDLSDITKKLDSLNELDPSSISVDVKGSDNAKLLKLQEDDRQRIAADLHDTVLQNLTLVMHNLELASKFIDYDPIRAKLELETNRKLVKDTVDDIRSTIFDLRPMQFDDFGFKRTVENVISNLKSKTNMEIEYIIDDDTDIDNIYLLTSFRIMQELVNNAIKHSEGTKINVQILNRVSDIYISVSDNGNGIKDKGEELDNHFGLRILKERVSVLKGSLTIDSDDKGTRVVAVLPIE